MKVFTPENSFEDRINFLDSNNVLVGFQTHQDCCETSGWYFSKNKKTDTDYDEGVMELEEENILVKDYNFDPDYFEEVKDANVEEGGMIRFRLIDDKKNELFLHIFNSHNGYYSHGFSVSIPGKKVIEGSI